MAAWCALGGCFVLGSSEASGQQVRPPAMDSLLAELDRAQARVSQVEENYAQASESAKPIFDFQRRLRWLEHHAVLREISLEVERTPGAPDSVTAAAVAQGIERELERIASWTDSVRVDINLHRHRIESAPVADLVEEELRLTALYEDFVQLLEALTADLEIGVDVGLDYQERLATHDSSLVETAEQTGAAVELAAREAAELRAWRGTDGVDTTSVKTRIAAAEQRVRGTAAALQGLVALLDRRGYPTADYRALIVTVTGEVGTSVLDLQVVRGLLRRWGRSVWERTRESAGALVLRLILMVLVLAIAARASRVFRRTVTRVTDRSHLSKLVKNLMVNGATTLTWAFALLIVLSLVGIDLGPMLAGLGIAGVVVGFALQDTLANFAAGMMIMLYRPFDVGDFVTAAGVIGDVKRLTLVSTIIRTPDNQRIIVPNGKVWGDVINNATAERVRRVDLVFGIGYGDDIDHARAVLQDVLAQESRVLKEPAPMVRVSTLGEYSVDFMCRPWCRTEDYWELKWDLTEEVKRRFDAEGISIPFPQRDVHLIPVDSPKDTPSEPE